LPCSLFSQTAYDIDRLNQLHNLKVTLLFTYSGIDNEKIEPYQSHVAADSLKLMSAPTARKYRTVLYWRPLVPGLNDTDEHLAVAHELSKHADATVFTGLFYRDQIAEYYKANGILRIRNANTFPIMFAAPGPRCESRALTVSRSHRFNTPAPTPPQPQPGVAASWHYPITRSGNAPTPPRRYPRYC